MEEVPSNYKTAGVMMLIAGIFNILTSISLSVAILINVVASMGIMFPCLICCLFTPVQLGFGVYEIIVGMNVMNGKVNKTAPTISIIGIVIGALGLAPIPLVLEIIATVMFNNDEVKAWIGEHDPDLLT